MKHLAVIQKEFVKISSDWDNLSRDAQKAYLRSHPKSKRQITAEPPREYKFDYEAPDDIETAKRHHNDAMSGQWSTMRQHPKSRGQQIEVERQRQMYRDRLHKLHQKHPSLQEEYNREMTSD